MVPSPLRAELAERIVHEGRRISGPKVASSGAESTRGQGGPAGFSAHPEEKSLRYRAGKRDLAAAAPSKGGPARALHFGHHLMILRLSGDPTQKPRNKTTTGGDVTPGGRSFDI